MHLNSDGSSVLGCIVQQYVDSFRTNQLVNDRFGDAVLFYTWKGHVCMEDLGFFWYWIACQKV